MTSPAFDRDQLRALALRWMDEIWRPGSLETFDELHSLDFVDHSPAGRGTDRAAYRAGIEELYAAFPDFDARVEDLLVDDQSGKVTLRWSASGTQRGNFLGHAASERHIEFSGIEILILRDGKITGRWGEWDGLGLLEQLGEK